MARKISELYLQPPCQVFIVMSHSKVIFNLNSCPLGGHFHANEACSNLQFDFSKE